MATRHSHEIEEVGAGLRDGRTGSDLLPLDETVAIVRQIDEILSQIGVAPRWSATVTPWPPARQTSW